MLNRKRNGTLSLKHLDLEIFLGELFLKCNSEEEIDWLQKEISETVDAIADEARKGEL